MRSGFQKRIDMIDSLLSLTSLTPQERSNIVSFRTNLRFMPWQRRIIDELYQTKVQGKTPKPLTRRTKRPQKATKRQSLYPRRGRVEIEVFMARFRGLPCEICGSLGRYNARGTVGHHCVPVGRRPDLRLDERLIVVLCQDHHLYSNVIAPHSLSYTAQIAFREWLNKHRPDVVAVMAAEKIRK